MKTALKVLLVLLLLVISFIIGQETIISQVDFDAVKGNYKNLVKSSYMRGCIEAGVDQASWSRCEHFANVAVEDFSDAWESVVFTERE